MARRDRGRDRRRPGARRDRDREVPGGAAVAVRRHRHGAARVRGRHGRGRQADHPRRLRCVGRVRRAGHLESAGRRGSRRRERPDLAGRPLHPAGTGRARGSGRAGPGGARTGRRSGSRRRGAHHRADRHPGTAQPVADGAAVVGTDESSGAVLVGYGSATSSPSRRKPGARRAAALAAEASRASSADAAAAAEAAADPGEEPTAEAITALGSAPRKQSTATNVLAKPRSGSSRRTSASS